MRRRRPPRTVIVLVLSGMIAGCGADPVPPPRPSAAPSSTLPSADSAAAIVARLGDEDLVGQVLMPFAYGSGATEVSAASAAGNRAIGGVATPAELVTRYRLGGLILVASTADDPTVGTNPTSNVDSPAQVRALTDGLQKAAGTLPLLIGTDQEYGVVTRVRTGVTLLPAAMAFGAARDPALTEAAWRAAGTELAALGVNVDFAPVADVLGPAGSGVIGSRSYGSDPGTVAGQVAAAVRGLTAAGVAATLKHFPGHGGSTADSHTELPVLAHSRSALDAGDLPPFAAGISAGAALVMSGHLDVRAVDPGMPATFSRKVLTDVLRGQLGFQGVVVTDALNMAPARRWPPGEAAVRALLAGNDLLLMPPDLPAARAGLLSALRDGSLPRPRLVEAVTRVVTLKLRYGAAERPSLSIVASSAHAAAAAAIAAAAVTVLRGPCTGKLVDTRARVTSSAGRDRQRQWLSEALRAAGVDVVTSGGSVVHLIGHGDGVPDVRAGATVTVAMDTPYLLGRVSSGALVATYSSTQASMVALAAVLAGRSAAPGRSPVTVAGLPRSACAA